MTRKITNKILDMIEEGVLDRDSVIMACLKYMSENEVSDMADVNGFFEGEENLDDDTMEEEDESDPNGDWYDTSEELS